MTLRDGRSLRCVLKPAVPRPSAEAEQGPFWPGGRRRIHHAGGIGFSQEVSRARASPDDHSDSANIFQPLLVNLNFSV